MLPPNRSPVTVVRKESVGSQWLPIGASLHKVESAITTRHSFLSANGPAQAGRAKDFRLQAEEQSRPCLQPVGWADNYSYAMNDRWLRSPALKTQFAWTLKPPQKHGSCDNNRLCGQGSHQHRLKVVIKVSCDAHQRPEESARAADQRLRAGCNPCLVFLPWRPGWRHDVHISDASHGPTSVLRQGGPSARNMKQDGNPALASSTLVRNHLSTPSCL